LVQLELGPVDLHLPRAVIMRLGIYIFTYLAMAWAAFGAQVIFQFQAPDSRPQTNRPFSLYPSGTFTNGAGAIITIDRVNRTTDTNGSCTISNVYGGDYRGELQGTFGPTTNWYHFQSTNGTIYAAGSTTAPTNGNTGYRSYTTDESDGRFALIGASGGTAAPGTNLQAVTLGSVTTLSLSNTPSFNARDLSNLQAAAISGTVTNIAGNGVNISNVTAGAISGPVTNVLSVAGVPGHLNLTALPHVKANLLAATAPLKILIITDLSSFPGGATWAKAFQRYIGLGGSMGFSASAGEGAALESLSLNTSYTNDANSFPFSANIYSLTNGNTLTQSRLTSGVGITLSNRFCDFAEFHYLKDTNGGTFKVQTNKDGAGWFDALTVSSFGFGTNQSSTNLSFSPGYYSTRMLGVTGTNRVITGGMFYTLTNSVVFSELGIQGQSINDILAASPTHYYPMFAKMNPTLVVINDIDGVRATPMYAGVEGWMSTLFTNADLVYVADHPSDAVPGSVEAFNVQGRTNAGFYCRPWADVYAYFGTNIIALTNMGILNPFDTAHFTALGTELYNAQLWNDLFQPMFNALTAGDDSDTRLNGTGMAFFNSGKTNKLGIGTASPVGRLTVVDTQFGSFDTLAFGSFANQQPAIWGDGTAKGPGYMISGNASFTQINAADLASYIIMAGFNNIDSKAIAYRSGGIVLGGNAGLDPGSGTVYAVGAVSASGVTNRGLLNAAFVGTDASGKEIPVTTALISATHFAGLGSAPTAATNVACGGGSVLSLDANAHDSAFKVTIATGAAPTAPGIVFHLTYATAYANAPHIVWSHSSNAAGLLGGRVCETNETASGFDFYSAGTAMTASTNYSWTFITVQ
jgi:hypothetical protein